MWMKIEGSPPPMEVNRNMNANILDRKTGRKHIRLATGVHARSAF